jgi:hypothetical protein
MQANYNNLNVAYWTPNNPTNAWPKANSAQTNPANLSTFGYYDATFLKIRSLSLGYSIPAPIVKKWGMRSLRLYATAKDPFILCSPYRNKYHGLDPEAGGAKSSSDPTVTLNLDTPPSWSILFGLNVTF